ncbi:glycosyltransferase family 2 protein [Xenorhabdus ishibashii]|uniref:Glycosyl transferase, group 2 family protein n=1 Tax=Xenorhabdus ishibashii TaxID=1034471 RepID=A0A2D0KG25_9GAMM|nr:glycosyltransferase family 2 protein [Xenorhabdus ishibashii]PHM62374.1 glycosyl transferase, group 2 family protein [Xenorhabdus ishibashii]
MPTISIITPMFNAEKYIKKTITSVLNQTFEDWELIIIDDNSSDKSCLVVEQFSINNKKIKLLRFSKNNGAAISRREAIKLATGRYIAFLDSDDIWHESKLKIQLEFMRKNKVSFSYGDYYIFKDNILNKLGEFKAKHRVSFADICLSCDIGCLTVMIDRKKISDITIPLSPKEDLATWLTILKDKNIIAQKYPGTLAYYRISENSLSANKIKEIKKQFYVLKKIANLNIIKAIYCLSIYILKGILKHYTKYNNLKKKSGDI